MVISNRSFCVCSMYFPKFTSFGHNVVSSPCEVSCLFLLLVSQSFPKLFSWEKMRKDARKCVRLIRDTPSPNSHHSMCTHTAVSALPCGCYSGIPYRSDGRESVALRHTLGRRHLVNCSGCGDSLPSSRRRKQGMICIFEFIFGYSVSNSIVIWQRSTA